MKEKGNEKKENTKYSTPEGKDENQTVGRNYKIEEKIDIKKPLKEILEKNVSNFKNPKNEEFINNQILIDYITAEKYKGKEINLDEVDEFGNFKNGSGIKELLMYYKKLGVRIYLDNKIDAESYYCLQNYYFNENSLKKKIRIYLNIDTKFLKDQKKVKQIIDKIIKKISEITQIPNEELYVTNVRKNCLICDIYHLIFVNNVRKVLVDDINEDYINQNRINLVNYINVILAELGVEYMSFEQLNGQIIIGYIINNYIIPPKLILDPRYNKPIGHFGLRSILLYYWYRDPKIKNGKIYYYPDKRWEGFGLRIVYKQVSDEIFYPEDIFGSKTDWCICYANLSFTQLSYKIENIKRETFNILNNNRYLRYSLLFQCKIKRSAIVSDDNDNIILDDNSYIVPYRLLKEHIDS